LVQRGPQAAGPDATIACRGDKPSHPTNKIAFDKIIGVQITK